jgi:hypothetical protein
MEGHFGAAGDLSHIPPVKPSTSRGITLAANFDRALRLNAGAVAGRLADRDQQEADGPNHHDCETWHFSLLVTCTIGREYHRRLQVSSSRFVFGICVAGSAELWGSGAFGSIEKMVGRSLERPTSIGAIP